MALAAVLAKGARCGHQAGGRGGQQRWAPRRDDEIEQDEAMAQDETEDEEIDV